MKLRNILSTFKNGMVLRAILRRLEERGIVINPYYVIQEGTINGQGSAWREELEAYNGGFLGKDDLDELDSLGGDPDLNKMVKRLKRGDLCFGLRKEDKIVAYMWCDLKECNHELYRYELGENEVYLYNARVIPICRGKGVAPFMRVQCYRALEKYSKDTFISISDYFNTPAVRFKKKLGARFLKLGLYINLWDKYSWNWILRDYFPKQKNMPKNSGIKRP